MEIYTFFATCPVYLEELLKTELESFGATEIQMAHGGAGFNGSIETAYRACLWSRIANRILFPLVSFDAEKPEDIKAGAEGFEWENHFSANATIAVDANLTKTKICTPAYAALSVKDGIVDRARKLTGKRPSVDTDNPDIRLNIHITLTRAAIALDLSGAGLHKRGYRIETVKAAVRENTAAAVLLRSGWDRDAASSRFMFLDPMCGSGTLITEALLIASDTAPGISRKRFGFEKWLHHRPELWSKLKAEAEQRRRTGIAALIKTAAGEPLFFGRDLNPAAVTAARTNLRNSAAAELYKAGLIDISKDDFFKGGPPSPAQQDDKEAPEISRFIAVNPPYGERLNKNDDMLLFYLKMGEVFKKKYSGWKIALLTGHRELSEAVGLRAEKINTVYNGGIRCILAQFRIFENRPEDSRPGAAEAIPDAKESDRSYPSFGELSPGAQMMYNRLKKNAKQLKKWINSGAAECYRLYDADMPEYSVAVDIYPPEAVIQEYAPPKTIDPVAAAVRLNEAVQAVQSWLELDEKQVKLKQRKKQRGSSQYEKKERDYGSARRRIIREHGLRFYIDTETYLDTGIFLDSRPIRKLIKESAEGKSFLNLFCYTGTASVYAAAGGAVSTTSVDASSTYLDWAESNMQLNGFSSEAHTRVKSDCMQWLEKSIGRWDLIFLDPPTFSNSKDRNDIFDLQRDHENLIRTVASRLSTDGVLLFCNNFRKFKMSEQLMTEFMITDITERTLDPDFTRKKSIHRCWEIRNIKGN